MEYEWQAYLDDRWSVIDDDDDRWSMIDRMKVINSSNRREEKEWSVLKEKKENYLVSFKL